MQGDKWCKSQLIYVDATVEMRTWRLLPSPLIAGKPISGRLYFVHMAQNRQSETKKLRSAPSLLGKRSWSRWQAPHSDPVATLCRLSPSRQMTQLVKYHQYQYSTSSTAQGGGGSFKNRKPIGELGCCESGMAERSHWWIERCLRSPLFLSLFLWLSTYLPAYLLCIYLSIDLSISLSLSFI